MKIQELETFTGQSYKQYNLTIEDLNYLMGEFNISKTLNGVYLESRYNPKLSISIGRNIKFDNDISELKLMVARERIELNINILRSIGTEPHQYKQYLPTTTEKLQLLIHEFKYSTIQTEKILSFLKK